MMGWGFTTIIYLHWWGTWERCCWSIQRLALRAVAMAGEASGVSVLGGVLCTMEPSAKQCELLHYFLHSPLVHSLSARQRICTFLWYVWKKHITAVAMLRYLSICCEKLCFCSVVTRDEGNPGGCSASFNHTPSREKQCLFRQNSTSANWSMRLRGAPPPMPCWPQDGVDKLGEGNWSWWWMRWQPSESEAKVFQPPDGRLK